MKVTVIKALIENTVKYYLNGNNEKQFLQNQDLKSMPGFDMTLYPPFFYIVDNLEIL